MPPKNKQHGVSADEKTKRMLEIFASAEVFSMKELEKLGSKRGVHAMQVPEIIKGLCDDGLVDCDKIGGGNFFWALPSKQGQRKKARLETLRKDLRSAQTVIETERASIAELSAEREPSTQRTTNLARLSELTAQHRQLSLELKGYEDRDPTVLRLLGEQIDEVMEQAGRWGANLDCVRAYLESEMHMDAETFAGRFEVASQDYKPITWQNFASFLPASNVPLVRKATDDDDVFLSAGSSHPASQASRHVEKEDMKTLSDEGKTTSLTAVSPVEPKEAPKRKAADSKKLSEDKDEENSDFQGQGTQKGRPKNAGKKAAGKKPTEKKKPAAKPKKPGKAVEEESSNGCQEKEASAKQKAAASKNKAAAKKADPDPFAFA